MILKYSNYEVDIVENGKQAVEKTIDNVYGVMIVIPFYAMNNML